MTSQPLEDVCHQNCQRVWQLWVSILLPVLLLLVLSVSGHSQTTTGTTSDGFVYSATNNQISITGYTGTSGAVIIPSTIPSVTGTVTSIGNNAFQNKYSITSVTIPSSVNNIGSFAFGYCFGLGSAIFMGNAPTMGLGVFYPTRVMVYYHGAATGFNSPTWTDSAGDQYSASNMDAPPVIIGNLSATGTGSIFFSYQIYATNVPSSYEASGLPVNLSVNTSTGLISGTPTETGTTYATINAINSGGTGSATLFINIQSPFTYTVNTDGTSVTITKYIGSGGAVTIPAVMSVSGSSLMVTNIKYAFNGCTSLTSVTIPSSIISIGDFSFQGCTNLTNITIPNGISSIGYCAFNSCTSLTSITIPASVNSIGDEVFENCTSLASIMVDGSNSNYSSKDGVLFNIDQSTLLQFPGGISGSYTIPNSVTNIGAFAFDYCSHLNSVTIPASVSSIGGWAFADCTSLGSITVDGSNSNYSSVDGVLFYNNQTTLIQCPAGKTGSYTIPDGVISIGDGAFSSCLSLTDVTIPSSVTSIGWWAFEWCFSLKYIIIPDSVTDLGYYAFDDCTSLANVNIGNGVTSISENAFSDCTNLVSVTIGNRVTSIDWSAFGNCTSLKNITIPSSVTNIGESAFDGCTSLNSVTFNNSPTSIGEFAFYGCKKLSNVNFGDNVTSIGGYAFYGCTGLTSVNIPRNVTSIGQTAFDDCNKLMIAIFMGNAPTMGWNVFAFTASGFKVYYYNGATGFNTPTWTDSSGDQYSAVNLGQPPLSSWLFFNGLPSNASLTSIQNKDGVPLLMDYALNLDPTKNQGANIPKPVISGNLMSLTYYAGSPSVTYSVEASPDLQSWSTSGVTTSAPDINNFCTSAISLSGSSCFMRLKVVY